MKRVGHDPTASRVRTGCSACLSYRFVERPPSRPGKRVPAPEGREQPARRACSAANNQKVSAHGERVTSQHV